MRQEVKIKLTAIICHGTLWGDYDNPTIKLNSVLNETLAACNGNHYDDPTKVWIWFQKRDKTGRAEGEEIQ